MMKAKVIEFNPNKKTYIDERIDQAVKEIMSHFEKDLRGLPVTKDGRKYIDFDHFSYFIELLLKNDVEIADERNERVIGNLREFAENQKDIDPEIQQIINDHFFEML
jgi:hypothetical protein